MNNKDTLFPIVKDDIAFDTLLAQAKAVIKQQSGQCWSDTSENDPGITLLEACCYGASDLAYRHSLPLKNLLTPEKREQTPGDGIFPKEFGPQQMLTCGPITAEDYHRALLDLHSDDTVNGYFLFNDVQLICEPDDKRYNYWYNKEKREYSFKNSGSDSQLALRGNYWLYLLPSRETQADNNQLATEKLKSFLKDNRNLGENVSKIIWLEPVDLPLQINIQLDNDVKDIADIFAQVYMKAEQIVTEKPLRYTTQAMKEQGHSNEEIFDGPYLRHGWIPKLPPTKNYENSTVLNLSPLINRLLAIKGVQSITRLTLDLNKEKTTITSLLLEKEKDNWSWTIAQGYYPRLWGDDPLTFILETNALTITAKGGTKVVASKQDIEKKIITAPLIDTPPELLNWGKHHKVLNYYPVSNKLPACYGLQTNTDTPQQIQLHQFMLPFEQMLANGCAELALLPKLLAFKQRGNTVHGTQWPFQKNTVGQNIHQEIIPSLVKKLGDDAQINNNNENYTKELAILDYLLSYFGAKCASPLLLPDSQQSKLKEFLDKNFLSTLPRTLKKSLDKDSLPILFETLKKSPDKDFLSTQRGYLAQQPELIYQRNNIRIDKVSALQKRIAARLGLGGECFKENPELDKLPFYLIEHRQLLPKKPDTEFDTEQKPDSLVVENDQLRIKQKGTAGKLFQGQVINLIIFEESNSKFTLRGQMITEVKGDTFSLSTNNSSDLKRNLSRIHSAFDEDKLRWLNSPVWLEDMNYQLVYAKKLNESSGEGKRWITSSPQSPFPAIIKDNDEITLKYVMTPSGPIKQTDYELRAQVVKYDHINGLILLKINENSTNVFPSEAEAWRYRWHFSKEEYSLADRFSFLVSIVINYQLINNNRVDSHKLESWIKTEILAEFPAHISMTIHWLSQEHFKNFASTYKRWQNNDAPLGDEAYKILETLALGRLPSAETGIGNMRIASEQQRISVIGESGTEWNKEIIIYDQLLHVTYSK
ncbi:hypothetical protein [Photorhabdus sp. RM323S]|uniref:hypothetical protein n=1 Tax=Photorhabdus sp. RM323S TaxID=3342828 RepID=UPI0036DCE641